METDIELESRPATVSDYMMRDHRRLDEILADVVRMVDDGELERADHNFGDFDKGMARHIRMEEGSLFPAFEVRSPSGAHPIAVMQREHRLIESALGEMRLALARGAVSAFREAHRRLVELLEAHNLKEERVLYPAIDRVLGAVERADLIARMRHR
jgi:iron-sulfur cluster repair protein YtfE (RIC family)